MQITIHQPDLAAALQAVQPAVTRRPGLPVLRCALIDAQTDGAVRFAATDLDLAITARTTAQVTEPGALTVPATVFAELAASLPPAPVQLSTNGKPDLALVCGTTKATLKGIPASEFPVLPEAAGAPVGIPAAVFAGAVRKVGIAAARKTNRPILCGVSIEVGEAHLTLAAADSYRLAVKYDEADPGIAPHRFVIPATTLDLVARRCEGDAIEQVEIFAIDERRALLRAGAVEVVAGLLEGDFPAYERIIPATTTTQVVLDTAEFRRALRRAHVFARDNAAHKVQAAVTPGASDLEPGSLTLTAQSFETGDNRVVIDAAVSGPAVTAVFNVRYLLDAVSVIEGEQVVFETNGAASPGVLREAGDTAGYLHLVMPMHIAEK
ncbi:MAG: DNA polymerase III subunit beta [Anaerolineae bacterium]|nr:DNA polymerase III subunit beta [Anaerolineae bacterium]